VNVLCVIRIAIVSNCFRVEVSGKLGESAQQFIQTVGIPGQAIRKLQREIGTLLAMHTGSCSVIIQYEDARSVFIHRRWSINTPSLIHRRCINVGHRAKSCKRRPYIHDGFTF
jgi:hypothetical protein